MTAEEMRQHRTAWIPWILALVALFGINALSSNDTSVRRNDTADGVGLSLAATDLGSAARTTEPLVYGPPSPPFDTVCLVPGPTFAKREASEDLRPHCFRHEVARGRAPPHVA